MARIVICAENYGGPGTGALPVKLSSALSQRGHSVQGKAQLGLSAEDIKSIQADLVIGQHKAVGLARSIADVSHCPFVMIVHGERFTVSMTADLVAFQSQNYITGYKTELGNTPAMSLENGLNEFCDKITQLAEACAAEKKKMAAASAAERAVMESAATAAKEAKQRAQLAAQQQVAARHTIERHTIANQQVANQQVARAAMPERVLTAPYRSPVAKPKAEPTVSVIIVAQDNENVVGQTVHNVLTQTYKEIEVIVIDDGSTDNTGVVLSEIKDPRLMTFRRPWQSGRHAARNLGFSQSSGEFIIFMDAGDAVTRDAIGALVSRIRVDSYPGATFGKASNLNNVVKIRWMFAAGKISNDDSLVAADAIVLYRRAVVEATGAFKPAPTVREMDANYIQRASEASSIMFVDTPVGSRFGRSGIESEAVAVDMGEMPGQYPVENPNTGISVLVNSPAETFVAVEPEPVETGPVPYSPFAPTPNSRLGD